LTADEAALHEIEGKILEILRTAAKPTRLKDIREKLQALQDAGDIAYPEEYSLQNHLTDLARQEEQPLLDIWKSSTNPRKALVSLAAWRQSLTAGSVLGSEWSRILFDEEE
jgi:hypothetical protein